MAVLSVTPEIAIDERELRLTFVRSPGAGGQNVNKVATAAQLRFDAAASPGLPEAVRRRLIELAGQRATSAGEIVITAHRFRSQDANRRDAIARLFALIRRAAARRRPRFATRPSAATDRKRIERKRRRSEVKQSRGRVDPGSD